MRPMTTLGEVQTKVIAMSRNCTDALVKVLDLVFADLHGVTIAGEMHPLRRVAQRAIASRLNIPFEYLNRCPPEVQAYNLNHWLQYERNEELFFRFDGRDVRAIFTPRYKPVDNFEVLEKLSEMGYEADTQVQCHLDGEFLSLSIPDGARTFSLDGDRITPGISVANSEVGLSSLRIAVFFLRLKCTNGLIAKTQIAAAYRHVSRKILEDFPQVLLEVSQQVGRQRDQFRLSLESPVDEPLASLQAFNRQFQLGKQEQEAVDWAWAIEPGGTMFNVVNAYTRAAHFPELSAESSYRLQTVAGNILAMVK
jgi:hypothetical protein